MLDRNNHPHKQRWGTSGWDVGGVVDHRINVSKSIISYWYVQISTF